MLSTHPSYALAVLCVCQSDSGGASVDILLLGLLDGALVQLQLYHPSVWNTQAQKVVASAGEGVQTIVCNKDCSLIVTTDTVGVVKLWRLHLLKKRPSLSMDLVAEHTLRRRTQLSKRKRQAHVMRLRQMFDTIDTDKSGFLDEVCRRAVHCCACAC